jgi:hypothetical protein
MVFAIVIGSIVSCDCVTWFRLPCDDFRVAEILVAVVCLQQCVEAATRMHAASCVHKQRSCVARLVCAAVLLLQLLS